MPWRARRSLEKLVGCEVVFRQVQLLRDLCGSYSCVHSCPALLLPLAEICGGRPFSLKDDRSREGEEMGTLRVSLVLSGAARSESAC